MPRIDINDEIDRLRALDKSNPLSVSAVEGEILYSIVLTNKPKTIVEIGTGPGYSTAWMSLACQGMIYTIDEVKQEQIKFKVNNVKYLAGELIENIKRIPKKINLLFLDARHTVDDICRDIEMLSERIPIGGLVIVHDVKYVSQMGVCLKHYFEGNNSDELTTVGVKPSLEKWRYRFMNTEYGLGVARKLNKGEWGI